MRYVYTDAPPTYDYQPSTTDTGFRAQDRDGRTLRLVMINPRESGFAESQIPRYQSGLHVGIDVDSKDREWAQLPPLDDPAVQVALKRTWAQLRAGVYDDSYIEPAEPVDGLSGLDGLGSSRPRRHLIKITYEIITPEGEVADRGWINEEGVDMEPDEIDLDEGIDVIDKTVEFLDNHGATEPSEAGRGAAPRWWTAYEVPTAGQRLCRAMGLRRDYATCEVENHSFHLYGYSDEERAEVYLEARRREADEDADYGRRRDR